MLKTIYPIAALLMSVAPVSCAMGVLGTLIGVRLGLEHLQPLAVSAVLTGYPLGFLIGCLTVIRLIDAVGPVRAFAAFAGIMTASTLGYGLEQAPMVWVFFRLLNGFCAAGLYIIAESWLNGQATSTNRGAILAIYMVIDKLSYTGAQGLFILSNPMAITLFIIAGMLFSLAPVPLSISTADAPKVTGGARYNVFSLYSLSPLGVIATFACGIVNSAFLQAGPIFSSALGLAPEAIGLFMASTVAGGLLLQWPIGWLSDRFDRRRVLLCAILASALFALLMALFDHDELALSIIGFLFGGATFVIYPLAVGHANDLIPPEKVVGVSSGLLMSWSAGAVIGPSLASFLMGWVGPSGLYYMITIVQILLAAFTILRMFSRAAPPNEEQGPFVAMPTSPAVMPLNPRSSPEEVDGDGDIPTSSQPI